MEMQLEHPVDEIERLQRCINDLVSVLALPAIWSGGEPSQIVRALLDSLLGMLQLDLVYARLSARGDAASIEMVRVAQSQAHTAQPPEFVGLLNHWLRDNQQKWPTLGRIRIGDTDISIVPLPLGIQGEIGVIVAGSQRADFPEKTERLVLSISANQAAIGLHEARLRTEQKRIADELDRRVAQRTAELARANEELQLQASLLQRIPMAAWTLGPDGTPDFVNQKWLEYTGQTLDYVRSNPEAWIAAMHPDDRGRASRSFWEGIRSGLGFTMEARFRRGQDGTYHWHLNRALPLRDAEGQLLRFVGTSTDIEDLKRAEEKLRESEIDLRELTETIPEMLWSAASDGAIDYCNARLLDYTGFSAQEIMGNGWMKCLHPEDVDQTARTWLSSVATGAPYRVEVRVFHAADQTHRWCVANALPLLDQDGRILKWHGTLVDMHDWKQSQEELRNTQAELAHVTRVMTMGEITASIAHEVNQPLSGIITNASTCLRMLAAEPPNLDGARETARRTIRDGNRAADVITRLRALYSRKETATEMVDLNDATREVIALSLSDFQKNNFMLQTEFAEDLPVVAGDRVQLQQVILNLFRNSSDAMSDVNDRPRRLLIRTERDEGDRVRLTVQDTGIGFDPQAVNRLFHAFYTTKDDGMGMGLSVSRSIIESHEGRLWARLNDGPGATFSFSIPIRRKVMNGVQAPSPIRAPTAANATGAIRNS